jgi:hypothetical protein
MTTVQTSHKGMCSHHALRPVLFDNARLSDGIGHVQVAKPYLAMNTSRLQPAALSAFLDIKLCEQGSRGSSAFMEQST